MNKTISRVWSFRSDSNPDQEYQTLQYADGTMSCNCMGWTRRTAADGSRSCKHTRMVDLGTADQRCTASHHYQQKEHSNGKVQQHHHEVPKLGQRKFAV